MYTPLGTPRLIDKGWVMRAACAAGVTFALLACGSSAQVNGFGGEDGGAATSSSGGSSSGTTSGGSGSGSAAGSSSGGSGGTGGASDGGVDGTTGSSGGASSSGSSSSGATGSDAGVVVGDGGCGQLPDGGYVWPNPCSRANSDPWISQHHDQIVQMNPSALLLNFANTGTVNGRQVTFDVPTTTGLANQHITAWQWASRYHGYKDANAAPFINFQLYKVVDLRDTSGQPNSAKLPLRGTAVDYAQLNSQAFADLMGIPDPANPGTNLTLCGLFEKGIIHEVWGMVGDTPTNGPGNGKFDETAENKVAYDANNKPVSPLKLVSVSNGSNITSAIPCKVSVRIYDFNPTRGSGCHLHAAGHAWENYIRSGALPAFTKVAATFFNFDFPTRFGTAASFRSFYDACPYDNRVCINWQSNIHASAGVSSSKAFDFADMSAGCGNVHFPPNATTQYTTAGDVSVLTSCENYGLHNGTGGKDLTTPYQDAIAAADYRGKTGVASDCGGTQPTYIFASMPGLGNTATASDGTPMHNWWVYYYY